MILKHQYSDDIKNKKILIFGPEIPPIGGVSVHILRVCEKYCENNNIVKIIDATKELKNKSKFQYIISVFKKILTFKPDQIDYHANYLNNFIYELLFLIFLKIVFRFKILFIDHDPRYLYKKNNYEKFWINCAYKFLDKSIIIGNSTYQSYLDNKIYLNKYTVESPFLPLCKKELESKIEYPQSLHHFINHHKPLILFNAFEFKLINGEDLYGFDRAIKLAELLKPEFRDIGVVMFCAQIGDEEYFEKIKKLISDKNLQGNIFFLPDNYPLWPLFKKADLFIRPTRSDSYGVSIEEALQFNVKSIASNVCLRPPGTILFGSEEELLLNAKNVLKSMEKK